MYPTPPSPNAPYDPPLGPPSPQWPPPQGPPIPPPPPSVPPARVKHPRKPVLPVRPVNRPIALVVAAIAGLATDVVGHAGLVSVSGTALFMCLSAGLLATGRLRGRAAKVMVLLGGALGLVLAVRTSDWVVIPVMATAVILLLVGASIGSDTTGVPRTPSEALIRTAISACHLAIAPGVLRPLADTDKDNTTRHKHWPALLRGVLLALLVAAPLTSLLASADPVFRSWLDLSRAATHVALILGGAWLLLGLVRSSSSARDVPTVSAKASVGKIEATCALGTVAALYSVFVVAQLVALSDAGHRILTTRNLTYAQYARSGFFQLLACAALTLVVLLILRPHTRPDASILRGLGVLVSVLTIGIVITAVQRLRLYQAAYGLTELRLAALVASAWIGIMFALLAVLPLSRAIRSIVPQVAVAITITTIAAWAIANPAALVGRTNLDRAAAGHSLDASAAAALGPDAVPQLISGASRLSNNADRQSILAAVCRSHLRRSGGPRYNVDRNAAETAIAKSCTGERK